MKRGLLLFVVSMIFLLSAQGIVFAGSDYDSWVGQKVIFLPQLPDVQKFGYQMYSFTDPEALRDWISYDELAGKTATILSISEYLGTIKTSFRLDDDGKIVYGKGFNGYLEKIAFVSELENARRYIGKTVWNRGLRFLENYNWDTDKFTKVYLANLEPLTVVDVKWWTWAFSPLEFILRRQDGSLVSWRGSFSLLNYSPIMKTFEDSWYFTNPIFLHPDWPDNIWDAIRNFEIAIGMTKEMVEMSWGKPKKINCTITKAGTHEQWVYGDGGPYVYFENGEVAAIQD